MLGEAGLTVVDVEELPTHGGSLRTWSMPDRARRAGRASGSPRCSPTSAAAGLDTVEGHAGFAEVVSAARDELWSSSIDALPRGPDGGGLRRARARATRCSTTPASARTCSRYTVDRSAFKQGMFLPGTHIPIHAPEKLEETRPDYILILPWNLREEITAQLEYTREWGAQLVVPLPKLEVF